MQARREHTFDRGNIDLNLIDWRMAKITRKCHAEFNINMLVVHWIDGIAGKNISRPFLGWGKTNSKFISID